MVDLKKELKNVKAGEHLKKYGLRREPFYITNDPLDFVGRVEEQKKLVRYLVNMSQGLSTVAIALGNHGVGKTAFIERIYPAIDELRRELNYDKTYYVSGLSDFKNKFFPIENSDILIEARRSPRKVLLFIDDMDVIYEKYSQTASEIFDPDKFNIVGTWNTSSWNKIHSRGSSFKLPKADIILLENLDEDKCKEIIKKRLNNSAFDTQRAKNIFSNEVLSSLHDYSDGNPFVLITHSKRLLDYMISNSHERCDEELFEKFVDEDLLKRKFDPEKVEELSPKEKKIFNHIKEKIEITAEELSGHMGFTRSAAVQYLKRLEEHGLLHSKRKGRRMWYYVPLEMVYSPDGGEE